MSAFYGFDSPWYSGVIERFSPGDSDEDTPNSRAVKCLARANLASACIIAQAIDGLAKAIKELEADQFQR